MTSHYRGLESWQQDVDVYASVIASQEKTLARKLRQAEKALREADLNSILSRQQRFAGVLDNIERFNDWLALANEQEFDSWRRISALQASPVLATNSPEAEQARQKIRWLKGVMQWDLERKADERLRGAVRDLRDVGDVLTEAQAVRDQIERDMRMLPERYAALGKQADELAQRIEATKMRIEDSLIAQRALLRSIAVGELTAQKERLTSYTLQARLALATIYESPARGGD
jgi:chaperonin cofactor prefoldin